MLRLKVQMYVSLGGFRLCRRIADRAAYPMSYLSTKVPKPENADACLFGMLHTMQANRRKHYILRHAYVHKVLSLKEQMYVSMEGFRLCRQIAERAAYPAAYLIVKGANPERADVCLFGRLHTMQANS